ncbi:MAG: hypothetical protein J0I67_16330 [Bosea sp.]|nr:hypothetical protein [Bosea sp. (in: a-proteobacteria)]
MGIGAGSANGGARRGSSAVSGRKGNSGGTSGSSASGRSDIPSLGSGGATRAPLRMILVSMTTSEAPPIITRCSTLSRRTSTSWRCLSRSWMSTTPSRGWRVLPLAWPLNLSRPPLIRRRMKAKRATSTSTIAKAMIQRRPVESSKPNKVCKVCLMKRRDSHAQPCF